MDKRDLKIIERLMNELAWLWIDVLGFSEKQKKGMTEGFKEMCPGVEFEWKNQRIVVTGFKDPGTPS